MATVYGIDLGTTYSAIARINEQDMAEVINNFEGDATTPSAIFFEGGDNVVVGAEAKRVSLADPDNACLLIKREMGTDYEVEYQGQTYTPESLSALILKAMVAAANDSTGEEVTQVVITVPAYFGTQEREATRQAGQIAGLDVIGIVTEPVAAALSIGVNMSEPSTIMVYDLGGGTFDTTIMKVEAGKVEVIGIDGSRTLGGADWDEALVKLLIEKFLAETGEEGAGCEYDEEFLLDVRLKAEDAKKSLTKREAIQLRLSWGAQKAGVSVSREEFDAATRHLVDQSVEISRRTVENAQKKVPGLSIDRVLLVGGSSRMPMIADALRRDLGWDPVNTDFDLAVAKGAAIYGQAQIDEIFVDDDGPTKEGAEEKFFLGGARSLSVRNVLARSLGISFVRDDDSDDSYIHHVAHANDSLPLEPAPISARTVSEGQTTVSIELYEQAGEQESEVVEDNRMLKDVDLPFPKAMPKGSPIDILVSITSEGLVRVRAEDPASGSSVDLEATVSQLDEQQVEEATSQVSAISLRS